MAKVSLRIYNREIESMVDRGQLDEAIAHCRHILNTFPKNLETYRLLGKAYLEARRYNEATDIFERVLMAVPDDFVAHVGMSIISDEQKDMDAAIWHMERAFEVQPSNAAIQSELQRLFGRRDGVEPPKIRLNRGALAHMYLQGELYPQAIAEIKAVLEEDRERQDMQVLLARAYFYAGEKNESAEICAQLLKRYPYCLEANRVLVELLPESERGESPQVYRNRINELDPYAAFITGSVFHTEDVPDAAVSLERLDWDGQPVDLGQEWPESRGIGMGGQPSDEEEQPDWLKSGLASGSFAASLSDEGTASVSEGDNDIPDFLREAGWGRDTGSFQEGSSTYQASSEDSEEPELAEGDLPDWIKAMAPAGADVPSSSLQDEDDLTQDDVPDWLQGLGSAQDSSLESQPLEEGDVPDWLAAMKPEAQPEEQMMAEPTSDEDLPDWLAAMKPETPEAQQPQPAEDFTAAEPASEEDVQDWLADLKREEATGQEPVSESAPAEPAGDEDMPDWISALQEEDVTHLEIQPEESAAIPASDEDLPDWIAALKPAGVAMEDVQPEEEGTVEPASDEDLPDWLRAVQAEDDNAAAGQLPAEMPEEPAQEFPEVSSESLADWQIGDEEAVGSVDFDTTDTGTLGTTAAEQDDAIAWLESLAAKHGAKPEELVTDPNARKETAPDWVQQAKAVKEQEAGEPPAPQEEFQVEQTSEVPEVQPEASLEPEQLSSAESVSGQVETSAPSAEEQDDAIAWLESLAAKHGAKPEELVTDPNARKETAPEWVQKAAEAGSTVQPHAEAESPQEPIEDIPDWIEPAIDEPGSLAPELEDTQPHKTVSRESADETGIWLKGLEDESGEGSVPEPAAEAEEAPIQEGVPDWLQEMEAGTSQTEADLPSEEEAQEIPDWLSEVKTDSPVVEGSPEPEEMPQDVPDWLRGVEIEPSAVEIFPESMDEEDALTSEQEADAVPDWLTGVESEMPALSEEAGEEETTIVTGQEEGFRPVEAEAEAAEPDFTDWLKSLDTKEADGKVSEAPAEEAASEDLSAWLAGLEDQPAKQEQSVTSRDEDLPDWLRGVDEQETVHAAPTAPTDWHPVEGEAPASEEPLDAPASEAEPVVEEPSAEPAFDLEPEPEAPPERERYVEPVTQARSGMTGMLSPAQDPVLSQAQLDLTRGNVKNALANYDKLIKKGKMLDEIIFDLREAQYRYPVDVSIMQALGDAYMRANRLQDALDAYTKAEELLR